MTGDNSSDPSAPAVASAAAEGEEADEQLARRFDKPMAALGIVFVFVVLGQSLASPGPVSALLTALGWVLWSIFVAEFVFRAYVAQSRRRFWARNWWQVIFLAVPFLRFVRVIRVLRFVRVGSVLSSAIRGSRSAGRLLSSRVGWLAVVTVVVVLASSQLLLVLGSYDRYSLALHDAALATIVGESLRAEDGFAQILDVVLAAYSVGVFATLAGAIGAFFLRGSWAAPRDGPQQASNMNQPRVLP